MDAVGLTRREREIVALCADGKSDLEIANELGISHYTVGNHIRRILAKTGSANRAQAVAWAFKQSLLGPAASPNADGEPESKPTPEPFSPGTQPAAAGSGDLARPPGDLGTITHVTMLPRAKSSQIPATDQTALSLMNGLQEALIDPLRWDDTLLEFGRAFGSHIPMLTWGHHSSGARLSYTRCPTLDGGWIERYDTEYARLNPVKGQLRVAPDFFGTTEDLVLDSAFYESRFYTEYMRPLDHWIASSWVIHVDAEWAASLFLAQPRAHGCTTARERELGALILPFVRHTLNSLWSEARHHAEAARGAVVARAMSRRERRSLDDRRRGILLLDGVGHLIAANSVGEQLVREGRFLRGGGIGSLSATTEPSRIALDLAIRNAARAAERRGFASVAEIDLPATDDSRTHAKATVLPRLAEGAEHPTPVTLASVVVTVELPFPRTAEPGMN